MAELGQSGRQPANDLLPHLPAQPGFIHAREPMRIDRAEFGPQHAGVREDLLPQNTGDMGHLLRAGKMEFMAPVFEYPDRPTLPRLRLRERRHKLCRSMKRAVHRPVDVGADRRSHRLPAILTSEAQGAPSAAAGFPPAWRDPLRRGRSAPAVSVRRQTSAGLSALPPPTH